MSTKVRTGQPPSHEQSIFVEHEKWTKLWLQHEEVFRRLAMKLLRDKNDAEDALQEAFYKLAEKPRNGVEVKVEEGNTTDQAVTSYIVRVVWNKAMDIARRRYRSKKTEELTDLTLKQSPDHFSVRLTPEEELVLKSSASELNDLLKRTAEKLPRVQRRLLLFICKYSDCTGRNEQWRLWAEENAIDPIDEKERNTFDKAKDRLRERLGDLGLYRELQGKE